MSDEAEVPVVEAAPAAEAVAAPDLAPAHEIDPAPTEPAEAAPAAVAQPTQTPAQIVASADAIYSAQLTKASEPDPEAKKLRDMARKLWAQADAIDGPARIQARQMLQQHNQARQRRGPQGAGQGGAHGARHPHAKPPAG